MQGEGIGIYFYQNRALALMNNAFIAIFLIAIGFQPAR
jgi:hypothetical protein